MPFYKGRYESHRSMMKIQADKDLAGLAKLVGVLFLVLLAVAYCGPYTKHKAYHTSSRAADGSFRLVSPQDNFVVKGNVGVDPLDRRKYLVFHVQDLSFTGDREVTRVGCVDKKLYDSRLSVKWREIEDSHAEQMDFVTVEKDGYSEVETLASVVVSSRWKTKVQVRTDEAAGRELHLTLPFLECPAGLVEA